MVNLNCPYVRPNSVFEIKTNILNTQSNPLTVILAVKGPLYFGHSYYTTSKRKAPAPQGLIGDKTYKEPLVTPFVKKLKDVLTAVVGIFKDLMQKYERASKELQCERDYSKQPARRNQFLQWNSDDL